MVGKICARLSIFPLHTELFQTALELTIVYLKSNKNK